MKLLTATTLLLAASWAASCAAPATAEQGLDPDQTRSITLELEHQDGRVLRNCMLMFLKERDMEVDWTDTSWTATCTADEVAFARFLAETFDSPAVTWGYCAVSEEFEGGGAKRALAEARVSETWSDQWVVAAHADGRWYGMIPDADLEAYTVLARSLQQGG